MGPIDLLKHDVRAVELAEHLRRSGRRSLLLEGPSGTGKTTLAQAVAQRLARDFSCRIAKGDPLEREVDEHAIDNASNRPTRREVADYLLDAAEDLGELLSDEGIPFGKVARRALHQALVGGSSKRISEGQQRFLSRLLALGPGKRPLLIADDLHYWDPVSLRFLRRLLRGDLDSAYGRLTRLAVVLVVDPSRASPEVSALLEAIYRTAEPQRETLTYPAASDFAEVLRLLGLKIDLPPEQVADLHVLTGGDLVLSRLLVEELGAPTPEGAAWENASGATAPVFQRILLSRLSHLSNHDPNRRLIQLLAHAGSALTYDEVACALQCPTAEAIDYASMAAKLLQFIAIGDGEIRFTHERLRTLLCSSLGEESSRAHGILAECLRKLRPGDYGTRAMHVRAAGDDTAADLLDFLERLSGLRSGRYVWKVDRLFPSGKELAEHLSMVFEAMDEGAFTEAAGLLDDFRHEAPPPVRWELALLHAQILSEMNSDAEVERALGLLEELDEARPTELELWGRAKELQIIALANLRRFVEGRLLESNLRQVYQTRVGFDPSSALGLNRLRRRSEAIHSPIIANDRLKTALRFFAPSAPGAPPPYPSEYVATLNNLCANELLLGRFESARERALLISLEGFAFTETVLRRPEVVWSNVLLCELYNGGSAPPIADAFQRLAEGRDLRSMDGMLLQINLAAAQAAAGRFKEGRQRLREAFINFQSQGEVQPFVAHFATANLASFAWLAGDDEETAVFTLAAEQALEPMKDEHAAPYLRVRLQQLKTRMANAPEERVPEYLAEAFDGPPRIGESWPFFARPFLATDIQFWAET